MHILTNREGVKAMMTETKVAKILGKKRMDIVDEVFIQNYSVKMQVGKLERGKVEKVCSGCINEVGVKVHLKQFKVNPH